MKNKVFEKPAAVLFDIDNTLYSYNPCHSAGMNAARSKAISLFSISAEQFDTIFDQAKTEVKNTLNNTASSHSRLLYFQRMLELFGLGSQLLLALDFEQTYWRTFLSHAELFDGVKEFLDDLRMARIPTAIVTDLTAQIQFRKIVYFGLEQYFDYVVTSEEAGFDKPHSAPFNLALNKVNPAAGPIWMIGDSPINDIKGAKDAINAVTIQKLHNGVLIGEGDSRPDFYIKSFCELRKIISELVVA